MRTSPRATAETTLVRPALRTIRFVFSTVKQCILRRDCYQLQVMICTSTCTERNRYTYQQLVIPVQMASNATLVIEIDTIKRRG